LDIKHLDIKPSNIVIDDRNNAKIIDFGLSMVDYVQDPIKPRVGCKRGSPQYAAFEIVAHSLCTKQSDIFSLGLTIMLLLGLYDINDYISKVTTLPQLYTEYKDQLQQIISEQVSMSIINVFVNNGDITEEEYDTMERNHCFSMINSMVLLDRYNRPTIDEVLTFFMDYYSKL
jgi:serine/threonine protein kinase